MMRLLSRRFRTREIVIGKPLIRRNTYLMRNKVRLRFLLPERDAKEPKADLI
jgi:hypothetical protein